MITEQKLVILSDDRSRRIPSSHTVILSEERAEGSLPDSS